MTSGALDTEKAEQWSWIVNWLLLVMKLVIAILSGSKAVWAAFAGNSASQSPYIRNIIVNVMVGRFSG